jgi:2-keto-4-pentenoate hydratase/2-oxohepta-3-ene-1,7-dioic acid hydratase in catechol pathway
MKLRSFRRGGRDSYGAVLDDGVFDLGPRMSDVYPTLRDLLTDPTGVSGLKDEMSRGSKAADFALTEVKLLPPIADPARILAIGVNYRAHAQETGAQRSAEFPSVFLRMPSSVVAHGEAIVRPHVSEELDFEGELAIVIGRPGRYIARQDALSYVAGYSCFNDASIRDWQRHNPGPTPGKNFYHCGAFGPWLVTSDEIPDPTALTLETRLNGETVQHTSTDLMIHDVPRIIEYCSGFTPLEPGDVIATGTPSGVGHGRTPPLWMRAGDVIEVTISGIGTLRNTVVDEGE